MLPAVLFTIALIILIATAIYFVVDFYNSPTKEQETEAKTSQKKEKKSKKYI
jgi:large-conductance mechanosensitive channel